MRAAILFFVCLPAFAVAQTPASQTPASQTPATQTQSSKSEASARQRQGYVLYEGRWRLPQEIVYLQLAASRRLAGVGATPAAPASDKAPAVDAQPVAPRKLPPQTRCSTSTGLFTIRMQQVQLLGMDTVTVGVGNGTVRLQLPRTQVISIGTTVDLPIR